MNSKVEKLMAGTKIVAIVRGFGTDDVLHLAEAYARGGIRLIEVTFAQSKPDTWKDTAACVKAIRERFGADMAVGTGTVLTLGQLALCAEAGGEFIVSPNVDPEIIRAASALGLGTMPGAMTPTEAVAAWKAGADYVKLFPASALGAAYVKAIVAPLSHLRFLAVGGVGPDNVAEYLKAGCVGAGCGGNLVNREWVAAGEWGKIEDSARRLVANAAI